MSAAIMKFLQVNGEKMEAEIAAGLQLPMSQIRSELALLSVAGDVIGCKVTRYGSGGKKVEGTSYRLAGARSGKPLENMPAPPRKTR